MVTCGLPTAAATGTPLPIPCVSTLPRKPYFTYFHPQSTEIRVHPQFTKIRALSVRAQNNKPLASLIGSRFDYNGRREIGALSVRAQNNKPLASLIGSRFDYNGAQNNKPLASCNRFDYNGAQHNKPLASLIGSRFDYNGRRVTVGDVVNKDAVSGENFVYVYPKYYLLKRTLRFLKIKAESLIEKVKVAAVFLWKVSFSVSLSASSLAGLLVEWFFRKCGCGPLAFNEGTLYQNLIRPVFSGKVTEVCLSSVFGEGDPNQGIEKKRWKMIGQYIALNGGVVTAEEIVPYLDPQNTENMDDESYMLPVLQLFNGQPKVDEEGNILYHFPSVHCILLPRKDCGQEYAGRWGDQDILVDKFLKEEEWKFREFSEESDSANRILLCNVLFSSITWGAFTMLRISRSYMSHIFLFLLKMFLVHVFSLMVFSLITWCSMRILNAQITKRNEARERCAKALELPDLRIKRKLLRSRNMARKASNDNVRLLYKNENDLYEHHDYERQEWDQRLEMKIQDESQE